MHLIALRAALEDRVKTEHRLEQITRMVTNLTHIQALAYGTEEMRTAKNILAMANLTFLFTVDYCEVTV